MLRRFLCSLPELLTWLVIAGLILLLCHLICPL